MTELAPVCGVGVVVIKGDDVLLIRRGKPPNKGSWSLPGGRQDWGETVRETAVREVREETGVEIELVDLIDVFDGIGRGPDGAITYHFTLVDFVARWTAGEPVAGDDAAAAAWIARDGLPALGLWSETVRAIDLAFARLQRT
ncbi:MAG: NUDIX hydrolase [Alphaproteobacteria bacterium]